MLHTVYLAGLCQRRQWPEPHYQVVPSRYGYSCVVRVNNREYRTKDYHPSEATAKEGAALIAFNICRSFSVNDGMYPNGFSHDNVVQGRAVPVGAGRTSRKSQTPNTTPDYRRRQESNSPSSRSGGSSPDLSDDSTILYRQEPRQSAYFVPARHDPSRVRHGYVRR